MKVKHIGLLKAIVISFSFIIGIIIFSSVKVEAASSTDLYYPDTILADEYNESGNVVLKNSIDIYAYNNGAGYQIDSKKVRLAKVEISDGQVTTTLDVGSEAYNSAITISNEIETLPTMDAGYSDFTNKDTNLFDKITIKLDGVGIDVTSSNNSVEIKLFFEQRKYFIVAVGWEEYKTTVNTYKGDTSTSTIAGESKIELNKTDADFALGKITITSATIGGSAVGTNDNVYSLDDFNKKRTISLTITTSYAFTGKIFAYFSDVSYVLSFSNGNKATISLLGSTLISKDKDSLEVTFNTFKINGTDKYGASISKTLYDKTASFTLDTKAPVLTSTKIELDEGNSAIYDVGEVYPTFVFSEAIKRFTCTEITLALVDDDGNLVEELKDSSCADITRNETETDANEIRYTKIISGNGNLVIYKFSAIVEDMNGNVTTYTNQQQNCEVGTGCSVELVSSIRGVSTSKTYYYENETISFFVRLSSSEIKKTDYSSIKLAFDDDTIHEFSINNDNSVKQNGARLYLYYPVGDDVKQIEKISFYKKNDNEENISVYIRDLDIHLNEYFSLNYDEKTITNPKTIAVYDELYTTLVDGFDASLVSLDSDISNIITSLNCMSDYQFSVYCQFEHVYDDEVKRNGSGYINVGKGAITLSGGYKNDAGELHVVINTYAPTVNVVVNDLNLVNYNDTNYYKTADDLLTLELNDVYADTMCLYYTFDDGKTYENSCKDWKDAQSVVEFNVMFPKEKGTYSLMYYTGDGTNYSSRPSTYTTTFTYVDEFNKDDVVIELNDKEINAITNEDVFNHLAIEYDDSDLNKVLLKSYQVVVEMRGGLTKSISTAGLIEFTKSELGSIDDLVTISITLTDKLGNVATYSVNVNLDTVDPTFASLTIENTKVDDGYTIKISGYEDNTVEVKVDGVPIELDNYSFTTKREKYSIVLTDKAGNTNEKSFTTVPPSIELFELDSATYDVTYEINISPFVADIHQIEDYRYLVFDYALDVSKENLEIARNNVCTIGRKINCYKEGSFNPEVGVIEQTFTRGYTYVLEVRINNILVNDYNTGNLPRLQIVAADTSVPVGSYLDIDSNPEYVSSLSDEQFKFSFISSDSNLTASYYYLVVNSSIESSMNTIYFYDLYMSCYGATSSSNNCALKGENEYISEVKDNSYLGEIIIESNYNTKRRFQNNTRYVLFVLLTDTSNNATVFRVREFKNISQSSIIEYENDLGKYEVIDNGEEATTINTARVKISSYKPSSYDEIEISSIMINNVVKSCSSTSECIFDLGIGTHVIKVEDALGNISEVTIYSAIASNPVIYVHYKYGDEYFRILDSSLHYNTSNAANVFVKVMGNELNHVRISMNTSNIYQIESTIFDSITDINSEYGMSLLDIMNIHNGSVYSGDVGISAKNENDGETSITLKIDNEEPVITLTLAGTQVNLLGNLYTLNYSNGKYQMTFNYQRDITYTYLMKALQLKVDGIDFEDAIKINRFKFRVDGELVENYDASITKGDKVITIDYFDSAGNVAETITLEITSIDSEAPTIRLINEKETVELNTSVKLADLILVDNHDDEKDLSLQVEINGNAIDYTNHKFTSLGTYDVNYTLTDTSGNSRTYIQTIVVKDTTPPTLKADTITSYEVALGQSITIEIPTFIDSDVESTNYKPHLVKILDPNGIEMDSTRVDYPLQMDGNNLRITFNYSYKLAIYSVVFVVKDSSNNANEAIFEVELKDVDVPNISIKVNDKIVEKDTINAYALGSNVVLSATAQDGYDGNLDNKIIKTIWYNGNVVSNIDTSKSGDYIVEFKVSDSNNNIVTEKITIRINQDVAAPVINKVYINDKELLESGITKINGNSLNIVVDASDDCTQVSSSININNTILIQSGETISIDSGLSDELITIKVTVKDTSGNETIRTYTIVVDNKYPHIVGVEDNRIYTEKVTLTIQDENISLIDVYKDNVSYASFTNNVDELIIDKNGVYRVVATDSYGNVTTKVFVIMETKSFDVSDGSGTSAAYSFASAMLVEAKAEDGKVIFTIDNNDLVGKRDSVHILVKYPESNDKYVAASMNGQTYLSTNTWVIDNAIIEGVDNLNLLEKIGDKYYAYMMIIEDDSVVTDQGEDKGFSDTLKTIAFTLLVILGIASILILFVKVRRRVRAV